ncbi:MAG: hypothetical protein ACREN6_10405 [Gemmatimonadaceae bacterium]
MDRIERVVIDERSVADAEDYFALILPPFNSVSIYDGRGRVIKMLSTRR